MDNITHWIQAVLGTPGSPLMRLFSAIAIALAAWVAAFIVRRVVDRLLAARRLDDRLNSPGLSAALSSVVYGLVWLFALPALLGALGLEGLLVPVNAMMSRLLGFVPNVMGALVVLGIGFLASQIVRQIVSGLLVAAGSERLAERLGLGAALGERKLAEIIGTTVQVFILLPTVAAAFQSLGLEVIAAPVTRLLDQIIGLLPRFIAAGLLVVITAVLGRVAAQFVVALTAGLGVDRLPAAMGLGPKGTLGGHTLSDWIGRGVMAAILFVGVMQASEVLGFAILTVTVSSLGLVLVRLAAAGLVLLAGLWVANLAALAVQGQVTSRHGPRLALMVRLAVLFFAGAMALHQAGLPSEIVNIAFAAVVGSLALGVAVGLAIAIGFGSRPVATRYFDQVLGARLDAARFDEEQTPS